MQIFLCKKNMACEVSLRPPDFSPNFSPLLMKSKPVQPNISITNIVMQLLKIPRVINSMGISIT